jgi:hypothetical protein
VTACRAPSGTRIAARLLPPTTETLPHQVPFYEEVEVASFQLDSPAELAAWTPERIDKVYEQSRDGLLITTSSPDPSIFRAVDTDAASVEAIRVKSSGLTSDAYMQLYWAGAGEPFSEERTLGVGRDDGTGALIPTYTFRVKDHPRWTGKIAVAPRPDLSGGSPDAGAVRDRPRLRHA